MTSLSSIKVPVFEGNNFEHWRLQMENIFIYQEGWEIVKDGYVEPAEGVVQTPEQQTTLIANMKNNSKATYILHQGIHESLMDRVIYIKQAKAAWDDLVSHYTGSDKVKKTLNLVNEMKANGDTVEDSTVVEKIIRSLPEKYEAKVTAIEECNTAATMSLNELLGRSNNGGYQGRNNTGGRSNNAGYQGRKPLDLSKMQFYNYGIFGHFATTCTKPRRTTTNNYKSNFKANIVEKEEKEEDEVKNENMLLACHTAEEQFQLKWYLDTGCSNHMYGRNDLFDNLDESIRSTVKFGNNSTIPVMGK
ncbi:uncharacterized protein LOC113352349 [Papaver somniferum]|uniref:uncharacterized protein LOC113352349 n=1 Tax=Papaver somniferum TaxID=3469 RepID=UPI000E6F8DD5|nr:uncharacterized protein LOC113352349 [Papaver somniferum]